MRQKWFAPALGGAILVGFIALLELASRAGWVSPYLVPPPSEIAAACWRLAQEEPLAAAFFTTLLIALAATLASALIGIPAGWLMYRHPAYGVAYEGWAGAMFSAPLILLYPLFLVLFGRNLHTIAIVGFVSGVIPVLLKTYEGLDRVPQVLVNVGRSFKMSERQILHKVLLPSALPTVFTGLRLSFIYTTLNVVGLEYLANFGGLGFLVGRMYDRFDIPAMYGAVMFVLGVSVLGFHAAERLEQAFAGRRGRQFARIAA